MGLSERQESDLSLQACVHTHTREVDRQVLPFCSQTCLRCLLPQKGPDKERRQVERHPHLGNDRAGGKQEACLR